MRIRAGSGYLSFAAWVLAATASSAAVADDLIALQLPGVPGNTAFSSDIRLANAIEIVSLANGVLSTGGGAAPDLQFSDFSVVKHFDAASPALFLSVAQGKRYTGATVTFFHNNGNVPRAYYKITLTGVLVTNQQLAGVEAHAAQNDTERVSLSYEKICLTDLEAQTTACWDQRTHSGQ